MHLTTTVLYILIEVEVFPTTGSHIPVTGNLNN